MWLTVLALAGTGLVAGMFGAMLGLGGGIFLVPALTLLFGLPMRVAVGASLIGVIATSAAVASVSCPGRSADVNLALRLEIASTLGALLGGLLAGRLSLASVGIASSRRSLWGQRSIPISRPVAVTAPPMQKRVRRFFTRTTACTIGRLASASWAWRAPYRGLTGTGGGFIKVPVMYSLMDVPLGVATASSNFMVGITAAASALLYFNRGDIYPLVAVPTALGVFVGALAGVWLAARLRVEALRKMLVILLVLVALQMAWKGLRGG